MSHITVSLKLGEAQVLCILVPFVQWLPTDLKVSTVLMSLVEVIDAFLCHTSPAFNIPVLCSTIHTHTTALRWILHDSLGPGQPEA
jgi:hypothetical protein